MPLTRLGDYLSQSSWNRNLDRIEAQGAAVVGRGILTGCKLTEGDGLVVNVSAGVVHASGAALIVQSTSYALPEEGTFYVWIDGDSGALSHSSSPTDPGNPMVCLGVVTTDHDSIVSISETGRVELLRFENGSYKIGAAGAIVLNTNGSIEASGSVSVGGTITSQGAVLHGVTEIHNAKYVPNESDLSEDLILTADSKQIQALSANGANRNVFLPEPSSSTYGSRFMIMNVGSANNIVVRDHSDTTTIATLTPGQVWEGVVLPQVSGGGGSSPTPSWQNVGVIGTGGAGTGGTGPGGTE